MGLIKTTVYCDPLRGILYVFGVVAVFFGAPAATQADVVRIATYDADLTAKGPGLLLRDIAGTGSPRLRTTLSLLTQAAPDILLLVGVDYDYYLTALSGLRDRLQARGLDYPYLLPNGRIRAWQRRLILMEMVAGVAPAMRRDLVIFPVLEAWRFYQNFRFCQNGLLILVLCSGPTCLDL